MTTPSEAYTITKHCAVFGKFLFERGPYLSDDGVAEVAGPLTVFYSRRSSKTYPSLAAAQTDRIAKNSGASMRHTPDADGLVFDANGALVYRFDGPLVQCVKYIGQSGDTALATGPCTSTMLGLDVA